MGVTNRTSEFLAKFPMGKVPALEAADGFCVTEGHAIARFVADSGPKSSQLLGRDTKTRAQIEEWSCFAEHELAAHCLIPLAMCVVKYIPADEARYAQSIASFERALRYLNAALQDGRKFLVGDELTLADVMVLGPLFLAASYLLDAEMRASAEVVVRYIQNLLEIPELKKAFGVLVLADTRVKI
jgi:elongation factor 1-gamma